MKLTYSALTDRLRRVIEQTRLAEDDADETAILELKAMAGRTVNQMAQIVTEDTCTTPTPNSRNSP
jgi:hypothetical protein